MQQSPITKEVCLSTTSLDSASLSEELRNTAVWREGSLPSRISVSWVLVKHFIWYLRGVKVVLAIGEAYAVLK